MTADAETTRNNRGSFDSAALRSGKQAEKGSWYPRSPTAGDPGHPGVVPDEEASARTTGDPSAARQDDSVREKIVEGASPPLWPRGNSRITGRALSIDDKRPRRRLARPFAAPKRCHPERSEGSAVASFCGCFLWIHSVQCTSIIGRLAFVPVSAQIRPDRVHRFNQRYFLCTSPTLQFLLAGVRPRDGLVSFKPNHTIAFVLCREALVHFPLVLNHR